MTGSRKRDVATETKAHLQGMGFEPVPVLRAIRAKCLDCSGGSHAEVADCSIRLCALFPFRLGKNPWRAPVSEAQRQASRRNVAALANPVKITGSSAMKRRRHRDSPPRPSVPVA